MESITIKELTRRLVEPGVFEGMETSDIMLLEDTIWGPDKGIFRMLGDLRLPIQYATGGFVDGKIEYVSRDLFTLFTHDFFDGIMSMKSDGEGPLYIGEVVEDLRKSSGSPLYIHGEGHSDRISSKLVVQEFLEKYFRLHSKLIDQKETDPRVLEARYCLMKSFVEFDREK